MLDPDRKCAHQVSPVGVAGGVYELPCRVGEVSGPFENTEKLFPAHSP